MKPTPQDRLLDNIKPLDLIEAFSAKHTESTFCRDERDPSAVCWQLLAIVEAAAKLPEEFRMRHAGLPWQQLISTRNFLAHGYNTIKPERIWAIIVDHLPSLRRAVEELLST
jgi:uncharacterized protein with HEPN domain